MLQGGNLWRDDIDSLGFRPPGHGGMCVVHRRAFVTLLGFQALPADCLAWFEEQRVAFESAAAAKISHAALAAETNFHLTSRDIRRALANQAIAWD
jgi:hypothetical protein